MKKLGCGCLSLLFLFFASLVCIFIIFFVNYEKPDYVNIAEVYIEKTNSLAINIAKRYDLYPSVIIAQSGLESNWGESELSKNYNNYFGIKANKIEDSVKLKTNEFVDGNAKEMLEPFRKYNSKLDSFNHYAQLMTKTDRYKKVRVAESYEEAAHEIKNAGYATDPNYDKKIIDLIKKYNLEKYDKILESYK